MKPLVLLVLFLAALSLAQRCYSPGPVPVPGTGGSPADAGLDAATGGSGGAAQDAAPDPVFEACWAAGARLEELKCLTDTGAPLWVGPDGTPFRSQCVRDEGRRVHRHPECIQRATTCEQANQAARGTWCGSDGGAL